MLTFVKNSPIILLVIGGLLLTVGDIIFKKWVINPSLPLYLSGLLFWLIALNALAFSFKYKNIAVASVILVLFNIISLIVVSAIYFKEPLSYKDLIGVVLGLVAVTLLEID